MSHSCTACCGHVASGKTCYKCGLQGPPVEAPLTHHATCYREHHACAVARLDALRALELPSLATDGEASAHPYWIVIDPPAGRIVGRKDHHLIAFAVHGPFTSRERATRWMEAQRHNLGKHPIVWCASGHMSQDWRAIEGLLVAVRDITEGRT